MKQSIILVLTALNVFVSKAQDACQWYHWSAADWPNGTTQDFEQLMAQSGDEQYYLDQSDFEEGGDFEYQTWEDVFWSDHDSYRPLGFKFAQVGANNDPTVCLNATDVAGYKVELMVYTLTPEASLCMEDMSADNYNTQDTGAMGTCDSEYIYQCFTADTDDPNLSVSVYCGTNCEDGTNIDILYRFRRSKLTWDDSREFTSDNPEMWCNMIASNIAWPDEIEEAVPENYEANDNLSSGNMVSCIIALTLTTLFGMFH